jgi:hypothetical protein
MAAVMLGEARLGREMVTLLTAAELAAQSLARALESKSPGPLALPKLERFGLFESLPARETARAPSTTSWSPSPASGGGS